MVFQFFLTGPFLRIFQGLQGEKEYTIIVYNFRGSGAFVFLNSPDLISSLGSWWWGRGGGQVVGEGGRAT